MLWVAKRESNHDPQLVLPGQPIDIALEFPVTHLKSPRFPEGMRDSFRASIIPNNLR